VATLAAPRRRNSLFAGLVTWCGGRLLSAPLLLASAYGLWSLWSGPAWRVDWVEVVGCQLLSPEQLVAQSGLADAWAVALVPGDIAERLTGTPGVVAAGVAVSLPNRVRLVIEEDRPVAVFRVGEKEYWVSERGQVMEPFGAVGQLPVLKLVEGDWPGGSVSEGTVGGLLAMLQAFPGQREFPYAVGKGFVLTSEQGYPVYLGEADDLEVKLALLAQLGRGFAAKGSRPQFVDLRTASGAYFR